MASETTGLLSDQEYATVTRWLLIPINILVSSLGVTCNTINLIVFTKMTNKDTMTLSLTALSLSDFLIALLNLIANIFNSFLFNGIPVLFMVDLESLVLLGFIWTRPMFHKISCMITTFVSFERALCVVKPFLVKRIFTKRRNITILITFYIVFLGAFMPVHQAGSLTWQYPENSTAPVLKASFKANRFFIETVVVLTVGLVYVWITQTLIVVNAIVMAVGLRRSRKFRNAVTSSSETNNASFGKDPSTELQTVQKHETQNKKASSKQEGTMTSANQTTTSSKSNPSSAKEDRLIKTVLILAVMHVSLNTPLSIYYILYPVYPEFAAYRRYHNLFMTATESVNVLESLNGVFNIFVYLTLNSKYKLIFNELMCKQKV